MMKRRWIVTCSAGLTSLGFGALAALFALRYRMVLPPAHLSIFIGLGVVGTVQGGFSLVRGRSRAQLIRLEDELANGQLDNFLPFLEGVEAMVDRSLGGRFPSIGGTKMTHLDGRWRIAWG
jgi:hypothetical protein